MRAPRQAGLTLLEVLGAFALLAILYTVLAGKAMEGLRSEAQSRQRLEASLIADERLAEIELEMASGAAPPTGLAEEEREPFRVVTEVKPFELPARSEPKQEPRSLEAKRAAKRREVEDVPSLFTEAQTGKAPALLDIEVVVRWEDGIFEREVRRRTYAVDPAAVEAAFEALAQLQLQRPTEPAADEDDQDDQQGQQDKNPRSPRRRRPPRQTPQEGTPPPEPGVEP